MMAANACAFDILIRCFCTVGRLDLAFAAFGLFLRTGWRVQNVVLNQLIKGLCDGLRTGDTMDMVFRRMPELGYTPDVFSYNALIKGLCTEKKSQEALELLLHMTADGGYNCSPDVVSYNIVIDGFFKEGDVDKAYFLFHEMPGRGFPPDLVTYSSVIDGLCKAQAMDKAEAVLQQMLDKGVMPNTRPYNSLIHGYCSLGQLAEAIGRCAEARSISDSMVRRVKNPTLPPTAACFMEMRQNGLRPNVVSYSTVIDILCKTGRVEDAVYHFNQMVSEGLSPNIVCFTSLIHGLCTIGEWKKVGELTFEMINRGIHPNADRIFMNTIMDNQCKEGRVVEAQDFFDLAIRTGVKPDVISYNIL
ncbi:Protein Rf1, mitochondrial [Zea mays]|uniref:Protein Rf1, mitochondrial n=1 Tax=Zea mays TaxID=4577 RepID=A0A3L6DYZ0_MAIZE|nr:Protein Rf1, mitochondrial [Zea mays]